MKNSIFLILALLVFGCFNNSFKGNQKLNFKVCDANNYKFMTEKKDSLYPMIIDKYEFRIGHEKTIVQFLFKFENIQDTFCLFEERNGDSRACSVGEIYQSFLPYEWAFFALDTNYLKNINCLLAKKGNINYTKYKNFNSVQGHFCFMTE